MSIPFLAAKAVLLFILLAALAACGSGGPDPTPTATQQLEARAEAAYSYAAERNWSEQAQYFSPRAREVCGAPDYATRIGVFADLLIGMESLSENPTLEFTIREVVISGSEGTVYIDFSLDGQPASIHDEGKRRWVFLDGQWWEEHEAWQDGCVGWKLFQIG